jgi:hypothetical protein
MSATPCDLCIMLQIDRRHQANPTPEGQWWCGDCLGKRYEEIIEEFQPAIGKLLHVKEAFAHKAARQTDGPIDETSLSEQQQQEALEIQVKIARWAGMRDAYLFQAVNGQYLDFREPVLVASSGNGYYLLQLWHREAEADDIWHNYARRAEVDGAYIDGLNESFLEQWHNRGRTAAGHRRTPTVVQGTRVRSRFAQVMVQRY